MMEEENITPPTPPIRDAIKISNLACIVNCIWPDLTYVDFVQPCRLKFIPTISFVS